MFTFNFATEQNRQSSALRNVLCLGAHSDDIEIGCGGALLKLTELYPHLQITWVVFSALGERAGEAQRSAEQFLSNAGKSQIILKSWRDGYFPYEGAAIKDFFEELKPSQPDLIFTHYRDDRHQDHRLLSDLTWNTFRNHLILEYEIPKYDADLGSPNCFFQLSAAQCQRKIELLMAHFQTQANRYWFSPETFQALLRLRGVESRSPTGYAEGFYCRKLVM